MEKICKIPECCGVVRNRGLCNKHYLKLLRHGDPLIQLRKSPGTVTEDDRKKWKRDEYQRNKEKYIKRAEKWVEKNPEKARKIREKEENKKKARQRTRDWSRKNKDRKRVYDEKWAEKNKALVTSYKAARRARVRKATPDWLTDSQIEAIRLVYFEAERLGRETGIPNQVDHIVPLNGKTVSGLHVPWNLRAIPAEENNRRPRIWDHNTQI